MEATQTTNVCKIEKKLGDSFYINKEMLHRNLQFHQQNNQTNSRVHFCLYSVDNHCFIEGLENKSVDEPFCDLDFTYGEKIPYLQFYVEKDTEIFRFPIMNYETTVLQEEEENFSTEVFEGGDNADPSSFWSFFFFE
jgi:hypothetical protein